MKKISAILLALIGVLGLAGCNKQPSGDPPAAEVKTFDISGAEKLTVISGSTGESMDITSAEDIEYMTDNINALEYSKGEEVNSDGWSYALQWYNANGETIEKLTLLGDGHTIIFDGYYYKGMSADYKIDLSFLEEQFAASPVAFVPAVMYNGDIYCTTENQLAGEVAERAIVGEINSVVPLTQWPEKDGQANFEILNAPYAVTSDGLVVLVENEWTLFEIRTE